MNFIYYFLKDMMGDINAKELEIDTVTDKMHKLQQQTTQRKASQVCELGIRYQLLVQTTKECIAKWLQYVSEHQTFDTKLQDCKNWLKEMKEKLPPSIKADCKVSEMEEKLNSIQVRISFIQCVPFESTDSIFTFCLRSGSFNP